jgi:O-succinylbenzoate synthase
MLDRLAELLAQAEDASPLTLKWKVAVEQDAQERSWLEQLLDQLPPTAQLRLDANGGWDRSTATAWMTRLRDDPRFAWLEQPLAVEDHEGLEALAGLGPVALDESLTQLPSLRQRWSGWQVRRPSQEGDPRPLLQDLQAGLPHCMVSTAFETGIGRRWLDHLAGLQWAGPTPAAPGLAPGWCPPGPLFSADPEQVWQAAF